MLQKQCWSSDRALAWWGLRCMAFVSQGNYLTIYKAVKGGCKTHTTYIDFNHFASPDSWQHPVLTAKLWRYVLIDLKKQIETKVKEFNQSKALISHFSSSRQKIYQDVCVFYAFTCWDGGRGGLHFIAYVLPQNWKRPSIGELGVPREPWARVHERNQRK